MLKKPRAMEEQLKNTANIPCLTETINFKYKQFESCVESIIRNLPQNNITEESCYRANLLNSILQIVACDFNQKETTNTNQEFTVSS